MDYYIGLDIGTNSVGYAVVDKTYKVLSYNGKSMWGIRLFDEAVTAEKRRLNRIMRRRLARRRQRIKILQDFFAEEIAAVDMGFYRRLQESALWKEDRHYGNRTTLFMDKDFTDREYYKQYPTIYHLRRDLCLEDKKFDIRLIYLALHHILKKRGHFLFPGTMDNSLDFFRIFEELKRTVSDELELELVCEDPEQIRSILLDRMQSRSEKEKALREIFTMRGYTAAEKRQVQQVIKGICGLTLTFSSLLNDDAIKKEKPDKISFASDNYDDKRDEIELLFNEKIAVTDALKAVYDWSIVANLMKGGDYKGKSYLSVAKVSSYEKHEEDLKKLKQLFKDISLEAYNNMFRNKETKDNKPQSIPDNYVAYVGKTHVKNQFSKAETCTKDEFYKYVEKQILCADQKAQDPLAREILQEIKLETFMPLQVTSDNGAIPHQLHLIELQAILENAKKHYAFLNEKDEDGLDIAEKIIKTFTFRIPYYVGPLHKESEFAWFVRREDGKITPWNFERKVDAGESANRFIRRMTNKCTYLYGEDVLPKHSLLYAEYEVLNELNNLRIGTNPIPVHLKRDLIQDVYKTKKKVTVRDIKAFLTSEGYDLETTPLAGFNQNLKASLGSYNDFKKIFGCRIEEDNIKTMIENIILWISIYPEDPELLKDKIINKYDEQISEAQLRQVLKLRYKGWGRLSEKFLQSLKGSDKETGEYFSVIEALRDTENNLMQLLSGRYTFQEEISAENSLMDQASKSVKYQDLMGDIALSPAIKRATWQSILLVEEIKKVMKAPPTKIFIEMSRGEAEKKRTVSRKEQLLEKYKKSKKHADFDEDIVSFLEREDEGRFRSPKVYLYYTQLGRCMYSGEHIALNELFNTTIYDRDHIYPRSLTKDDSLDNLVLVKKSINAGVKKNRLVPSEIQEKMRGFWTSLKDMKLISPEKYSRLTRKEPLTDAELAGFINRQLVETRQSIKLLYRLLEKIHPNTDVVSVKSSLVSDLRQELERIKCRSLNDLHHAKDAYLSIVAGNVYYEKFTKNPYRWIRQRENRRHPYNLYTIFKTDLERGGEVIWKAGKNGSERVVLRQLDKNDILYTRYAYRNKSGQNGGFFDQNIVKAANNPSVPIKKGMDMDKYGGYKNLTTSHFALVEAEKKKGRRERWILPIPLYRAEEFEEDENAFRKFLGEKYVLHEVRILLPMIKKDSLLRIDGFPMHLRGISGNSLLLQGAVQLYLDSKSESYIRQVEKFMRKLAVNKTYELQDSDGISSEKNVCLYQTFLDKLMNSIYKKRTNNQAKQLREGLDRFRTLSEQDQALVLNEILHIFGCSAVLSNLKLIGRGPTVGKLTKNINISRNQEVILIHQSVTGLFERRVDLLTL